LRRLILLCALALVMAGCAPSVASSTATASQSGHASATATVTATPTATDPILNPLAIEAMRQRDYPGSDLAIEQTLPAGTNYKRYIASYQSDGFKIFETGTSSSNLTTAVTAARRANQRAPTGRPTTRSMS
jgi:hypothetical protein